MNTPIEHNHDGPSQRKPVAVISGQHRLHRAKFWRAGAVGVVGVVGALVFMTGCSGPRWDWTEPAAETRVLRPNYRAFAAQAIRVHPLTHLALVDGQAEIVCHIEVLDRWGDSVKALGMLQVQLYQVQDGIGATGAVQILKWDVPLADEKYNAGAYDPATQTYRLSLGGLPGWIADVLKKQQAEGAVGGAGGDGEAGGAGVVGVVGGQSVRLEIRAVFQTLGPHGQERVLRDGMGLDV